MKKKLSRATNPAFEGLETRRLLASVGSLDTAFGGTGWVEALGGAGQGWAVAVDQTSGNVVVAGQSGSDLAVVQFSSTGSINWTYTTGIGTQSVAEDVVIDGSSIYVAGTSFDGAQYDPFIIRLNSSGSLDGSFVADPNLSQVGDQFGKEMVVASGNIYLAGAAQVGGDLRAMVVKMSTSGTLDSDFGTGLVDGIGIYGAFGNDVTLNGIARQADGQIVIGGNDGGVGHLARIIADGSALDSLYGGGDGVSDAAIDSISQTSSVDQIALGAGDAVFTVGTNGTSATLLKFDSSGTQDSTFGGDGDAGYHEFEPLGLFSLGGGVNIDASGRVVVTGTGADLNSGAIFAFVSRYDQSGTLDTTFGSYTFSDPMTTTVNGIAWTSADGQAAGSEVAFDASGNDIIGGSTTDGLLAARFVGESAPPPPTPVFVDGNGNLVIPGTAGNDIFDVQDAGGGDVHVFYNGDDAGVFSFTGTIQVTGLDGNDLITIASTVTANANITGGQGDDTITGGGGADSITGGAGNDVLSGQGGNDTLRGNAGNDNLDGGDDNDDLLGGADNDTSVGGAGNDSVANDAGDDELMGGVGDDTLRCGGGADVAYGEAGNDSIIGGTGDDSLYGGADNDTINGGAGNDVLDGESGNDDLNGGGGTDIVLGGSGSDIVQGGADRDILIGGLDSDSLIGNAEEDVLIGGATDYDGNLATLQSALTVWTGAGLYAARVATLSTTIFIADTTVHDDLAVDTLSGGAGTDWFIANTDAGPYKDILDIKSGETVTDVD